MLGILRPCVLEQPSCQQPDIILRLRVGWEMVLEELHSSFDEVATPEEVAKAGSSFEEACQA